MNAADLVAVMERFPELTYFGFGTFDDPRGTKDPAKFEQERQALRDASLDRLTEIEAILAPIRKTKNVSGRWGLGSYGLKHTVEKSLTDKYCTNGELICVALHLGFPFTRCGPNASLGMFMKDVKALRAENRMRRDGRHFLTAEERAAIKEHLDTAMGHAKAISFTLSAVVPTKLLTRAFKVEQSLLRVEFALRDEQ
jgi:hypothetical protein